jgi:hypothetical protein
LRDVSRVLEVDIRISEMQLEADTKLRISCTARQLFECIVLEGIDAAEATEFSALTFAYSSSTAGRFGLPN